MLEPMNEDRSQRKHSPRYRPAPHTNNFTNPQVDYHKLREERRRKRGERPTVDSQKPLFRRVLDRFRR